jgi:hypothetical protein
VKDIFTQPHHTVPIQRPANIDASFPIKWYKAKGSYHKALKFAKDGFGWSQKKPHAICVPFPTQWHVTPMMRLAKLLHSRGFRITFVNTVFNHMRLIRSKGPDYIKGLLDFRFETIPDGLSPNYDATQDIPALGDSTGKNCLALFKELVLKLNCTSEVPPITCIV